MRIYERGSVLWVQVKKRGRDVRLSTGSTSQGKAETFGKHVEKLVDDLITGDHINLRSRDWVNSLPPTTLHALERHGLIDPTIAYSLDTLVDDYEQHLCDKGSTAKWPKESVHHARTILEGCRAKSVTDITPEAVTAFLARRRKTGAKAKSKSGGAYGFGTRTSNHYLRSIKSFTRWLHHRGIVERDPLIGVKPVKLGSTRRRRAMIPDELGKLLDTTLGSKLHNGMTGEERYWTYRVAVETGLRANELATLELTSFDLDSNRPCIHLAGDNAKNRKDTAITWLSDDLIEGLREYLFEAGDRPFPLPDKPAKMIKRDLKAAGVEIETAGGLLVFHALRHTFCTNAAARLGGNVFKLMRVMRVSSVTVAQRYVHADQDEIDKQMTG